MRKIADSSNTAWSVAFRACADWRSRPKGFSRITRAPRAQPELPRPLHHGREEARWNGEVVGRLGGVAQRRPQVLVRGLGLVVAPHQAEPVGEPRERRLVDPAVLGDARPHTLLELLERHAAPRDPDDRDVEVAAAGHRMERGKDLLVGEIAREPEEDERVGARPRHLRASFSTWPPNSKRIAESTRSWKSASPCEARRSKSAAASTCAGTPSSMAASSVQRPSPESDTRPAKVPSVGSRATAAADRPRSQELITLPRRHRSVMSARSRSYR